MTKDEFLSAVRDAGRDTADFYFLPGPDSQRSPEGCCVIDGRGGTWAVYREDRGVQDRVEVASESEAYEYALRRWVRWEDV